MKESPYAPEEVEVRVDGGDPSAVRMRKGWRGVRRVANVWRIDDEWWREPLSRMYFLVELDNGVTVTVFQDLLGGRWYRQNWTP